MIYPLPSPPYVSCGSPGTERERLPRSPANAEAIDSAKRGPLSPARGGSVGNREIVTKVTSNQLLVAFVPPHCYRLLHPYGSRGGHVCDVNHEGDLKHNW